MSFEPQLSEREKQFLSYWKVARKHRKTFLVKHGLSWGLLTALGSYFFRIQFDFTKFALIDLSIAIVVFAVGGLLWGRWMYRIREQRFKQVYPEE